MGNDTCEDTSLDDDTGRMFFVDLPNINILDGAWVNVGMFATREEALAFAREKFGADEEGRITIVSI